MNTFHRARPRRFSNGLVFGLALLVTLAGCRTDVDDAEPTPQQPGPLLQPGVVDTEPIDPDRVEAGPEWVDYRDETKFDAALAERIRELDERDAEDTLRVTIELRDPFNEEIGNQMQAVGLQPLTGEGREIVATGPPEALRLMTIYDYVRSISLDARAARP